MIRPLAAAAKISSSIPVAAAVLIAATGAAQSRNEASPAASPIPETATPQTYAPELIATGRTLFGTNCGFCHGLDAAGANGGADLTRSLLVAEDVRGNLIGEVVRTGRVAAGMPAFATLSDSDILAVAAYVHDQKTQAESATGGRRSVEVADLQTGNAAAGRRYFRTNCTGCHSATGDLAGIALRLEGLALMQRMLYPGSEARGNAPPPAPPTVTVTTESGLVVEGPLAYQDEFTIALTDENGRYRSWSTSRVSFELDDPLEAHVEQLQRYSDEDMHDMLAYLQTLR
jgi:cytochrome c oxidase cbb3-type subunit III